MSQLLLTGHNGARFKLNVTQFRAPMSAMINSVQTRTMMHHFPIRAGQPDIQFTVQFPSIAAKHKFQDFVRSHQLNARNARHNSSTSTNGAVRLIWPERDINGWTGYIVSMPVREARYEYAPRVTFGVALMDSMLSVRTAEASLGNGFESIMGAQIPAYVPEGEEADDAGLQPPAPPSALQTIVQAGTTVIDTFASTVRGLFS